MPQAQYHHGNLKEDAIATAFRMQHGRVADVVGIREVARELGVTHGALNRHFGSRANFLRHVAISVYSTLQESLKTEVLRRRNTRSKLMELGVAFQKFAYEKPGLVILILDSDVARSEEGVHMNHYLSLIGSLSILIEEGKGRGDVTERKSEDIAYVVWAFLLGYWENSHGARTFDGSVPTDQDHWSVVEKHFRRTFGIVLDGICPSHLG